MRMIWRTVKEYFAPLGELWRWLRRCFGGER